MCECCRGTFARSAATSCPLQQEPCTRIDEVHRFPYFCLCLCAVARAPAGPTRKVQSLGELNTQSRLVGHEATGLPPDADLALLSTYLSDPSQVKERDEVWDADALLQEVAQALAAEKEAARRARDGDTAVTPEAETTPALAT